MSKTATWNTELRKTAQQILLLSKNLQSTQDRKLDPLTDDDLHQITSAAASICKISQHEKLLPDRSATKHNQSEEKILKALRKLLLNIIGPCHAAEEECGRSELRSDLLKIQRNARQCLTLLSLEGNASKNEADPKPAPGVEPGSILVVDSNRANRELLFRFLRQEGHTALGVRSARDGIHELEEHQYELCILGTHLPDSSVIEVLSWLRETGRLNITPVIIVEDNFTESSAARLIMAGAESVLPNPPNANLLLARVRSTLEKTRLRLQQLEVYFSPKLARHLLWHPELLQEGRSENITVLFCDVQSFSSISEKLEPRDTMIWLCDVLELLTDCVMKHEGVLVDYVGDELIAIWGAPKPQSDHAERAVSAAQEMLRRLPVLDKKWDHLVRSPTEVTIGIHSGLAFLGNVGTSKKFKYGCLGNTVNLSSRTQGANKYLGTKILLTKSTRRQIPASFETRRVLTTRVVNIKEPVDLYELPADPPNGWRYLKSHYEQALKDFENKQLHRASSVLGDLLFRYPNDGPSLVLISRVVDALQKTEAEFDPVFKLPGK